MLTRLSRGGVLGAGFACAAPALLVALAVLLPTLNKAFTIDDVTFLLQAKHVLHDPLHPTAFEMVFDGTRLRLSQELVSGPVMAYLLLPSVLLGGAEWAAHAVQVILLISALLATAALALRLGADRIQAGISALLLVCSPAVLAMAATAMPDVPAMAFAVIGMERLVAWKQTRRRAAGLAAAVSLAMGALSRPHVLLLLVCGSIWLIPEGRRGTLGLRLRAALEDGSLIPVAIALVLFGVVVLSTGDPASGQTIANASARRIELAHLALNAAGFAQNWAVAFPLAILWPVLGRRRFPPLLRVVLSFDLGILLGLGAWYFGGQAWRSVPVLLLLGLSVSVLIDILLDARRRRDRVQLVLGVWLLLALPAATYVHLPAKLLVPSAPAMAVLLALQFPRTRSGRAIPLLLTFVSGAGLALGILIIRADSALAEIGRVGGEIVRQQIGKGQRVWMDGGWGFQWYAMTAGAAPLADTGPSPRAEDVIVVGLHSRGFAAGFPEKTLLLRRVYAAAGGRVDGDGAGFFTNRSGPWPWVWGHGEVGRLEVWRINEVSGVVP